MYFCLNPDKNKNLTGFKIGRNLVVDSATEDLQTECYLGRQR
jgi:hypothetical protein